MDTNLTRALNEIKSSMSWLHGEMTAKEKRAEKIIGFNILLITIISAVVISTSEHNAFVFGMSFLAVSFALMLLFLFFTLPDALLHYAEKRSSMLPSKKQDEFSALISAPLQEYKTKSSEIGYEILDELEYELKKLRQEASELNGKVFKANFRENIAVFSLVFTIFAFTPLLYLYQKNIFEKTPEISFGGDIGFTLSVLMSVLFLSIVIGLFALHLNRYRKREEAIKEELQKVELVAESSED